MAFEDAPEFRLLRRLLVRIAPLYLIDPAAPDFSPEGCKTAHDVIRFIHEKAVQELMDLPRFVKRFKGVQIWTLVSDLPLGLKVLDLGGGIDSYGRRVASCTRSRSARCPCRPCGPVCPNRGSGAPSRCRWILKG